MTINTAGNSCVYYSVFKKLLLNPILHIPIFFCHKPEHGTVILSATITSGAWCGTVLFI